jgi:peroxiredoxin
VASHKNAFDQRSVSVAVVSFAEPAKLTRYQEQHRWPFMILADPKRQAYQRFALRRLSLGRVFSLATLKLYFKLLREGMRRKDYGGEDIYQGGGDFLLDREGNILFAHRSQNPADRPSIETLLREIDRIATQAK